ncbi:hypothetical protein IFR23_13180 [Sphingomonas sp. CFBP 13603]|uniref:hypothetical protein n=1 Tax=Sphingomonas sp. CFBP 13603 TaxID=2774040 RepID=UPI001867E66C|nr:hypothetical protein [Sphingomonas sp. CFBP 13603]MBE2992963.1 hypothetical protein [Sphingomonas sp. CFBP 13603]
MSRNRSDRSGSPSRKSSRYGLGSVRGFASAAILVVAGVSVGWLSFQAAMVRTLPASSPIIARFAPKYPDAVLARTATMLVAQRGMLDTATLDAVRRAAAAAPLDARAYLILGHQQLLDQMPNRAVATLEAGQRLDPRQRLIHLLLLDRYLRTARYADAAAQFSVLARILGATQVPIATAMAKMTMAPETRDAVRHTLSTDPVLERGVLTALAKSDTAPDAIFALASPAGRADARAKESWGPVLVNRLVERGQYPTARSVWQRIYGIAPAQTAALITNAGFRKTTASPPFDWTLTASGLGAADIRNRSLMVDYYGRDSGDLARQLLVLQPGRYRFAITVDPGKTDGATKLYWSLACGSGAPSDRNQLMNVAVTATPKLHRIAAEITVPTGCPAQTLTLRGEAGDFPSPMGVTLRDLDLRPLSGPASAGMSKPASAAASETTP